MSIILRLPSSVNEILFSCRLFSFFLLSISLARKIDLAGKSDSTQLNRHPLKRAQEHRTKETYD